ncbi:MAG TPA: hypothetical protein VD757_01265, partial [Candidatus Nitrosocosmicus sp.]|nr:hypothetical protein [Candidatus Nitrosocosmicus sp.]
MTGRERERGSYTIEISMIFTLIIFVVLLLMFMFLYMQQKACLVSAAAYAAQQGAEIWLDSRKSMEDGEVGNARKADPINYRVFDNLLFSRKTFEGYIKEAPGTDGKRKPVLKMNTGSSLPDKKARLIGEALCSKLDGLMLKPEDTR